MRGIIVKREEVSLTDVLRQDNYKNIIPVAHSLKETMEYLQKLYGIVEGHSQHITLKWKEKKEVSCRKS